MIRLNRYLKLKPTLCRLSSSHDSGGSHVQNPSPTSSYKPKQKVVFLFPGQGTQKVGKMIPDKVKTLPNYAEIFDSAYRVLDYDLEKLMEFGPDVKLNKTEYAQPAIYMSTYLNFCQFLQDKNLDLTTDSFLLDKEYHFAGYSLGEYNALVAANKISFEDALFLLNIRGKLMQKACLKRESALATVMTRGKKFTPKLEKVCQDIIDSDIKNIFHSDENLQNSFQGHGRDIYQRFKKAEEQEILRAEYSGYGKTPQWSATTKEERHDDEYFDPEYYSNPENFSKSKKIDDYWPNPEKQDVLEVAAYMSRNIFTVGGDTKSVEELRRRKKDYEILAVKYLNVSGAFHTRLMHSATRDFREVINALCSGVDRSLVEAAAYQLTDGVGYFNLKLKGDQMNRRRLRDSARYLYDMNQQNVFKTNDFTVYSNLSGHPYGESTSNQKFSKLRRGSGRLSDSVSEIEDMIRYLPMQIENPVRWHQTMSYLASINNTIDSVHEFGPGNGQLGKLIKQVNEALYRKHSYEFV